MKKSFLLLTLLSLALVGCEQTTTSDPANATSADSATKKIEVVASFYPLAFMAEQITGENANVVNLAGAVDVHEYEPTPQDLVKLNEANLVLFQGAELEPWTDGLIEDLKDKGVMTLEVSHDLDLAKMEEHEDHQGEEHEEEDEHSEEHEGEDEEHDEHAHGEFDSHTWLDPVLAQDMVTEILTALIEVDPTNQVMYEANAALLKDRFATLNEMYETELAQCNNEELIISHDAYGYLARRYGFEVYAIAGISPQDEPSAKILAELKDEADEGVTHILVEQNNVQAFAETLARETGLATLQVNPLGRGTLDPSKDFFDIMDMNLESFKIALDCQ